MLKVYLVGNVQLENWPKSPCNRRNIVNFAMQRCTKNTHTGATTGAWREKTQVVNCSLQTVISMQSLEQEAQAMLRMFLNLPHKGLDENLIKLSVSPLFPPPPPLLTVCTPCPNSASGFREPNIRHLRRNWISQWELSWTEKNVYLQKPNQKYFHISKVVYTKKEFTPFKLFVDDRGVNIHTFLVHDILTDSNCRNILPVIFCTHHLVCSNIIMGYFFMKGCGRISSFHETNIHKIKKIWILLHSIGF